MNDTTLPTLTGTDKQVAWAEKIRAQLINDFEAKAAETLAIAKKQAEERGAQAQLAAYEDRLNATRAALLTETKASVWIDARNNSAMELIRQQGLRSA